MISFFMRMTTKGISVTNSIPLNAASYGESEQTEVSDLRVAMVVQEKQKGHLNKLPLKPKRQR